MNLNIKIRLLFTFFFIISGINLIAQAQMSVYADIGENNVSDGLFVKTAGLASYQFGKYSLETGFQFDLLSNNENFFSGNNIMASREFLIKDFPLEIQSFFVWTLYSNVLRETNWGILLNIKRNHFVMSVGTNFRTYAYTQKAIEQYGLDDNTKIHENFNLMYLFSYYLKPLDNQWNIGLSVTNIDHFIINQETNPIFNLRALYKVSPPINLFIESWYKSAGAFNLSVNSFGYNFRTGIIWDFN